MIPDTNLEYLSLMPWTILLSQLKVQAFHQIQHISSGQIRNNQLRTFNSHPNSESVESEKPGFKIGRPKLLNLADRNVRLIAQSVSICGTRPGKIFDP